MEVKIGPYVNWIGPYQIAEKILFWMDKYEDDRVHKFGEFLAHGFNKKIPGQKRKETLIYKFCTWVHDKKKRKVKVKLDPWDSWNADHTLALIIYPVLKQLREKKHGSPMVDYDDVPQHLRPDPDEVIKMLKEDPGWTDEKLHDRWEWVMGEMIWAFEQELAEDDESQFFEHPEDTDDDDIMASIGKIKIDQVGLRAHQERKQNGFRLFGKYYQNLWD